MDISEDSQKITVDELSEKKWIRTACDNHFVITKITVQPYKQDMELSIEINEIEINEIFVTIDLETAIEVEFPKAVNFSRDVKIALNEFIVRTFRETPWLSECPNQFLGWDLAAYVYESSRCKRTETLNNLMMTNRAKKRTNRD